jgi:hypothetical protein
METQKWMVECMTTFLIFFLPLLPHVCPILGYPSFIAGNYRADELVAEQDLLNTITELKDLLLGWKVLFTLV